jgi:anti-sigma factor RsiW
MDCTELIAHYTDYIDGTATSDEIRAMEAHLAECASCQRYRSVLANGSALLQALPRVELREDFTERLQHRLYHVQDEHTLSERVMSGAPALTVLGIAVLLTAVAWAPMMHGSAPQIQLAPIVVDRAPVRRTIVPAVRIQTPASRPAEPQLDGDLWNDNTLLYEYSQLRRQSEADPQPRQVGFAPK